MATPETEDLVARAALLKSDGNALFVAKKFLEAEAKYTEAIELDPDNAILYGNRAACHLQNQRSVYRRVLSRTTTYFGNN
jgi:Flp pilus assembly protein TadD